MIHYRKTFTTYKFLASCMDRNLQGLHALGKDGETPLMDAFAHEFKCAVHVIRFNHLNDIFGRRIESTLLTGLVDSESIPLFEQKLTHQVEATGRR